MLNIIKADLYRIFKGKTIYVSFGVVLLFMVLVVYPVGMLGYSFLNYVHPIAAEFNGYHSAPLLQMNGNLFTIVIMPFITIVACPIFFHKTVKNEVSWGLSRTKLYVSRVILIGIISAIAYLLYLATGMVLATILGGFGGQATTSYVINILLVALVQILMLTAAGSLGALLYFVVKKKWLFNEYYVGITFLPSIIVSILVGLLDFDLLWLANIDLTLSMGRLGYFGFEARYAIPALILTVIWLSITLFLGLSRFHKAEVK